MARTKITARPNTGPAVRKQPYPSGPKVNVPKKSPVSKKNATKNPHDIIKLPPKSAPKPKPVYRPKSQELLVSHEVTFQIIYTHTSWINSAIYRINSRTDKLDINTKRVLLKLQGPVLVDYLVDDKTYGANVLTEAERGRLLLLLNKLGIFTSEEYYSEDSWKTLGSGCTPTSRKLEFVVHGAMRTIWLIETRRDSIPDKPTLEDIEWVENFKALPQQPSEVVVVENVMEIEEANADSNKIEEDDMGEEFAWITEMHEAAVSQSSSEEKFED